MPRSAVWRLPLDGAAPSMLKTTGDPIDQLSFLEDDRGHLNVLLRAQSRGEGIWNAERGAGELALMRVPLSSFGDASDSAPRSAYLLGYELVEGRLTWRGWPGEKLEELRRVSFAPQPSSVWGRD